MIGYLRAMPHHRRLALGFVTAGFALLMLAIVYWTNRASALPSLLPGHQTGSHKVHFKYGYVLAAFAAASFVYAWIESIRAANVTTDRPRGG